MPNYTLFEYSTIPQDYVSYTAMVDYVTEHGGTTVTGISYEALVDYVANYCTSSGGMIDPTQLNSIYASLTTLSGQFDSWEDYFIKLRGLDDMSLTYPTTSGDYYYAGGF